jgi:AhpD family alkylhydroperoxidase
MTLDERTAMLIAVGASIAANCQPCLEINVARAQEHGIDPQEISEAVEVGRKVRKGAAAKMDRFAADLSVTAAAVADDDCSCGCDR